MNAADWAAVRALFDAACGLPPAERARAIAASALDESSRSLLQAMLEADARSPLAADAAAHAPAVLAEMAHDDRPGQRLGPWRIETLIGAGGMGRVYRARREDGRFDGLAAIKFVAEAANPQFFIHERHVLGRLAHPGIARLLDAGEDALGQPYLVMELVDGVPIDAYCEQRGADARQRLQLVCEAARAIAHAHGQWVLHRDIKPANLLVDAHGAVKVLDFGVAKLLDRPASDPQHTTARCFTLRYAAPEQIAGEANGTAVDVYALAVVLYELLAAAHPGVGLDGSEQGLAERTLAGTLTPLRRALVRRATALPGLAGLRIADLDAVLARALARAPAQRYASMQEFADELERLLADRPVLARPPTGGELLRRFAQRHRFGVALGAMALMALVSLAAVASWQAGEAARERDLARREAQRAEHVASFLSGLFEAAQPIRNQGRAPSARELLDLGHARLLREAELDPPLRAALLATIADSYRALGHYDEAAALLGEALAQPGIDPQQALAWRLQRGRVHNFQSRWADAERELRQLLAEPALAAQDLLAARVERQLAVSLLNQSRAADADQQARSALARLEALPEAPVSEIVDTRMLLATLAYSRSDLPAALAAYEGIVAAQRAGGPADQDGLVTALNNLAAIEMRMDRLDSAVAHYGEAIERARARYGERNREVALPLLGLGSALRAIGRLDEAQQRLAEAHAIYRAWSGEQHPETAYAALLLAELQWLVGDLTAARTLAHGVADLLAKENPAAIKACRAAVLELALQPPATAPSPRQREALRCLAADAAPPNLRLLGRHVAALRGLDDRQQGPVLAAAALTLTPRDEALRRAIAAAAPPGS